MPVLGRWQRTEVRVGEVCWMVKLHHSLRISSAVHLDVLLKTLNDEIVICMVFLLDVDGTAVAGMRRHLGTVKIFAMECRGR